eukprot:CAMPEP_0115323264 /NCGR_PEP_ID=MMETSP0270-20121206/81851_1 /TAXON_ID=71861 /ORGANISM="Scrippsiella trochoidea, Strain CCMP3099" /LENGTH=135 /DNA_ID=CAMNT_0002743301 /DNA_START=54 /DNA_END=457 /DNA_ORIENTATION=-
MGITTPSTIGSGCRAVLCTFRCFGKNLCLDNSPPRIKLELFTKEMIALGYSFAYSCVSRPITAPKLPSKGCSLLKKRCSFNVRFAPSTSMRVDRLNTVTRAVNQSGKSLKLSLQNILRFTGLTERLYKIHFEDGG